MRNVMMVLALVALAVAPACGGKDKGDKGGEGGDEASAKPAYPSKETLTKLGSEAPEGFDKTMGGKPVGEMVAPWFTSKAGNKDGVKTQIQAMVAPCNFNLCPKDGLSKAAYEKLKDKLPHKMMLSKMHKENKDLVEEFSEAEVDGEKVVTVWFKSHVVKGNSKSGSRSFHIYWNNGSVFVKSSANGFGTSKFLSNKEKWETAFTKEEAQKGAELWFKHAMKLVKGGK